ncbi:hypothetical protein [Micromonospora sp. NPDC005324]|uniref:hypothetical protein n=1 Tax=Micromonospora sp. NPDC005324 TaxID=3157033 RepID=UPI0033BEB7A2
MLRAVMRAIGRGLGKPMVMTAEGFDAVLIIGYDADDDRVTASPWIHMQRRGLMEAEVLRPAHCRGDLDPLAARTVTRALASVTLAAAEACV